MDAKAILSELFVVLVIYAAVFLWLSDSRPAFRRTALPDGRVVFVPATDPVHIFVVLGLLLVGVSALVATRRALPLLPTVFFVLVAIPLVSALSAAKPQSGRIPPDQLPEGFSGPAYAEEPPTEPEGVMLGLRIAATAVGGLLALRVAFDRVLRTYFYDEGSAGGAPKDELAAAAERARNDPRVLAWQKRMEAFSEAKPKEAGPEGVRWRSSVNVEPAGEGWEGPAAAAGTTSSLSARTASSRIGNPPRM